MFASCAEKIDNTGNCTDGRMNQGEQGIDCGGPCPAICVSCGDGIKNQGEEAVDCGGPCDPCYPRMSAQINGNIWNSVSRNAFLSGPGTLRIYGTDQTKNITLIYSGPFKAGSVSTGVQFTGELRDENGNLFSSVPGGFISFTTFDTTNKTVSGTYQFISTNSFNSTNSVVSGGVFNVLAY